MCAIVYIVGCVTSKRERKKTEMMMVRVVKEMFEGGMAGGIRLPVLHCMGLTCEYDLVSTNVSLIQLSLWISPETRTEPRWTEMLRLFTQHTAVHQLKP